MDSLLTLLHDIFSKAGGKEEEFLPIDEDSPLPYTGENFIRSIEANAEILMQLPQSFINVKMTEPDEPQRSYVYVFAEANVNVLEPNGILYGGYSG